MGKKRWVLIVGIIIMAFLIFVPELGGNGEDESPQKPEAGPVESMVTQAPASFTPNPVIEQHIANLRAQLEAAERA